MKKTLALAAIAALTLTAAPAFAGEQANSAKLNGIQFNGINFNGAKLNGLKVNGFKFNGMKVNGIQFNSKLFNSKLFNGTDGETAATVTPTVTTVRLASGEALTVR